MAAKRRTRRARRPARGPRRRTRARRAEPSIPSIDLDPALSRRPQTSARLNEVEEDELGP